MNDKLDRYNDVIQALLSEAIACSPQSWNEGRLTIECDDSYYLTYALKNELSSEKAQISEALRQLCEDFYVVMRKSGDWWATATMQFFRKDGEWSFTINFIYPRATQSAQSTQKPAAGAPKPWWKFWQ